MWYFIVLRKFLIFVTFFGQFILAFFTSVINFEKLCQHFPKVTTSIKELWTFIYQRVVNFYIAKSCQPLSKSCKFLSKECQLELKSCQLLSTFKKFTLKKLKTLWKSWQIKVVKSLIKVDNSLIEVYNSLIEVNNSLKKLTSLWISWQLYERVDNSLKNSNILEGS